MRSWLMRHWRSLVLATLVIAGLALLALQPVSPQTLLAAGERLATRPLAVAVIVLTMAVLFATALPGSLAFWLLAPFLPPVLATALLLLGSVAGAWGGYLLANRLHAGGSVAESRLGQLLHQRGDLVTQCALRVLPGFPHSVINYAAGALGLPLNTFLLAATLGLAVKWGVYSSAVHGTLEALEQGEMLSMSTLWPLAALTLLLLAGVQARRRVAAGK